MPKQRPLLPVITFKSHKLGQNNQKDLKMYSLDRNKTKKNFWEDIIMMRETIPKTCSSELKQKQKRF